MCMWWLRTFYVRFSPCYMCLYAIYFHLWVRREGGNLIFITDALDLFCCCYCCYNFSLSLLFFFVQLLSRCCWYFVMSDFCLPLFLHHVERSTLQRYSAPSHTYTACLFLMHVRIRNFICISYTYIHRCVRCSYVLYIDRQRIFLEFWRIHNGNGSGSTQQHFPTLYLI